MAGRRSWHHLVGCVSGVLVSLAGCSEEPASTLKVQPVTGQVKRSDGSILQEGIVELRSQTEPNLTMSAIIDKGSFKLVTFDSVGKHDGVPAGTYEVRITAANLSVQGDSAPPAPITLKEPLTIAEGQTQIELTLP